MIDVINLEKKFGERKVLNGINLHIDQGEVIAIIGPSGGGKSTFLRCLNCLEDPTGGQIIFDGVDIADMKVDINVHRRKMGMVFQHFNLFANKTVLDNIRLAPYEWGIKDLKKEYSIWSSVYRKKKKELKEQVTKEALELLKKIDLVDQKDSYPSTLSGGQKQRIAIARSLAMKPEVLLFDEPTSALDPEMVGEVLDLIGKVAASGMTLLIVTHEMGFAKNVASRVLFIADGIVAEDAPPAEFFENPKNPRLKTFLSQVLA